jgi:cytochrome P450
MANDDAATKPFPPIFDPDVARCPHAAYRTLLTDMPVARMPLTNGPVLSRYEDVMFALRNPKIFSSEMEKQMALGTERPMIPQQIDPPRQTRYRKLLDPHFSRRRMALLEPSIRKSASALIDGFIDAGECEFDTQFAVPLPCQAFLYLLGLPLSDLDLFLGLKDGIIRPASQSDDPMDFEGHQKIRNDAGQQIYRYFEDVIALRRKHPSDDLMGFLVQADLDGEPLSDNDILDICFLQLIAGLDTVTATLGCNIAFLADNPSHRQQLIDDPSKMEAAIEELLRWETPVTGVPRVVKERVEIGGVVIEPGEVALLLLGAANLDPDEFGPDDAVDFDRERNRHIAFGGGPHRCLGSHLARMELKVAMEEWHRRVPHYQIKPGETPRYSAGIREVQYLPLVWD